MQGFHSRDGVTSRLRLRGFDYTSASSIFVTLCVARKSCLLGDVQEGVLRHTAAGVVMDSWWHSIPSRFPSVMVDAAVVMPNHLHGILHLGANPDMADTPTLSAVMHWYKTRTTYDYILGVKLEGWPRFPGKLWQKGYFDHIVRSDRELDQVRAYIDGNPAKWNDDEYHALESV